MPSTVGSTVLLFFLLLLLMVVDVTIDEGTSTLELELLLEFVLAVVCNDELTGNEAPEGALVVFSDGSRRVTTSGQ